MSNIWSHVAIYIILVQEVTAHTFLPEISLMFPIFVNLVEENEFNWYIDHLNFKSTATVPSICPSLKYRR
jgi:hypothetical protein